MGLQDPRVWRVLPKGRADILFLVAADLQMRQAKAVATHDGCASGPTGARRGASCPHLRLSSRE